MKAFSPDFLAGSSVSPDLNSATYVLILIRTVLECELADRSQSPDCGERLPVKTCGSPITIWIRGWQTASGGSFALLGPLGPGGVLTSCSRSTSPPAGVIHHEGDRRDDEHYHENGHDDVPLSSWRGSAGMGSCRLIGYASVAGRGIPPARQTR